MPKVGQTKKKTLKDLVKTLAPVYSKKPKDPAWAGPQSDASNGGITQSLISSFLVCRERFRLKVIEGLAPAPQFSHRMEYGNMWHVCEEEFAKSKDSKNRHPSGKYFWESKLVEYCKALCKTYPLQQEQIQHWYNVCKTQFPVYAQYWEKHPDVKQRTPLSQEQVFHVPYTLPSGRVVYLRGKFDSVDLIGKGKTAGIYLQENKAKGDIDDVGLRRQLTFDLQTMMYLIALKSMLDTPPGLGDLRSSQVQGVRYNVIRRPLSGGKGSIVQRKATEGSICSACKGEGSRTLFAGTKRETFEERCSKCQGVGKTGAKPGETDEEYYERLRVIIQEEADLAIQEKRDCHFFMRWKVEVHQSDIERYKQRFFNPILEQLCDWYDWVSTERQDPFNTKDSGGIHWQHPFGVWNSLNEGGHTDVDEYLMTGSEVGLVRDVQMFPELQ